MMRKASRRRGFMVISFVIAISVTMLGLLSVLASIASEQVVLLRRIEDLRRADAVALDCAYIAARVFAVHGSLRRLEGMPFIDSYVRSNWDGDGHIGTEPGNPGEDICSLQNLAESTLAASDASAAFAIMATSTEGFRSIVHVEMHASNGRIDLIKI